MQVSFIIPIYNALAHTRECLRTLQATLPAGLKHEIVFVDDGSTDGTREWLAGPGRPAGSLSNPPHGSTAPVRSILNETNLGFGGACNRGAAAATGEYLFFLNSDLVLQHGWFAPMRATFDRFTDAALVGNVQRNAATGAVDHAGLFFDHKGKPAHIRSLSPGAWLARWQPAPAVTGACFAIRAAGWRELGGFDEGFMNGGEDVDLCLRARAAGKSNYVATRSTVWHHVSASPGRKRRDEQNSQRLARRWRDAIAPLALPAWCRHYLEARWHGAADPADHAVARQILFYDLGLRTTPPSVAWQGVQAALDRELARWERLLGPAAA